jgi:hypothetical protein
MSLIVSKANDQHPTFFVVPERMKDSDNARKSSSQGFGPELN